MNPVNEEEVRLIDPRVYQCMRTTLLVCRFAYQNMMGVKIVLTILILLTTAKAILAGLFWLDVSVGAGLFLCLQQQHRLYLYLIGIWGKPLLEMDNEAADIALRSISNMAVEGRW